MSVIPKCADNSESGQGSLNTKEELLPAFYAVIPANVRYDKNLKPNAKLLFGEITALCNKNGYCWASNEYFANLYDVTINTVTEWISSLVKKEYLIRKFTYKPNSKEIDKRILCLSVPYTSPVKNEVPSPEKKGYLLRKSGKIILIILIILLI